MSLPIVPGFALVASYSTAGDGPLLPTASLAIVPTPPLMPLQAFTLIWNTLNVASVRIRNASDTFDTGIILNPSTFGGSLFVPVGFAATQVLTLYAFDAEGDPLTVLPIPTVTVTITGGVFGQWLFNENIMSQELLTCGIF